MDRRRLPHQGGARLLSADSAASLAVQLDGQIVVVGTVSTPL
jgi:hypothetical protein